MRATSLYPTCGRCAAEVVPGGAFCSRCGAPVSADRHPSAGNAGTQPDLVARRRLGGTIEFVPAPPGGPPSFAAPADAVAAAGVSGIRTPAGRRRRRARRWYRRPLVVVPLLLLVLLAGAGGAVLQRVGSTVSAVRAVSTPPPEVVVEVETEDILAAGGDASAPAPSVRVNTAPAVAALVEAGHARPAGGGGLFGGLRAGAASVADAGGIAIAAAGVTDLDAPALTILVMGVDARPGEPIDVGVRPDVLMVVRLDPVAGACRLLSVPRDTRAELPGYGPSKVNHALMVGGIDYQLLVVERLLGVAVDRYALIDFAGFEEVVDAVGGIEVDVPEAVEVGGATIPAGPQAFDGEAALAFARHRDAATEGDVGRVRRQWAILAGLGRAMGGRDVALEATTLLPAVEDHVRTDLDTGELGAIADGYAGRCTPGSVEPAMLDGVRVRLDDPIMGQILSFNLVDPSRIEERVAGLMGEGDDGAVSQADTGRALSPGARGRATPWARGPGVLR